MAVRKAGGPARERDRAEAGLTAKRNVLTGGSNPSILIVRTLYCVNGIIGDWPSGKATGSGPVIGGSNPSSPATYCTKGDRSG